MTNEEIIIKELDNYHITEKGDEKLIKSSYVATTLLKKLNKLDRKNVEKVFKDYISNTYDEIKQDKNGLDLEDWIYKLTQKYVTKILSLVPEEKIIVQYLGELRSAEEAKKFTNMIKKCIPEEGDSNYNHKPKDCPYCGSDCFNEVGAMDVEYECHTCGESFHFNAYKGLDIAPEEGEVITEGKIKDIGAYEDYTILIGGRGIELIFEEYIGKKGRLVFIEDKEE